jgi:hypothetical protein
MVAPLKIESGITVEGGINVGALPTFTITSADISNPVLQYGGYSSYTSSGFTSDGNPHIYNGIRYDITDSLYNAILLAQTTAGYNPDNAWVWNANFDTGGSCLVRIGLVPGTPNTVTIAPINQTDQRWQTGNDSGPCLAGTFTFPATFIAYYPATALNGNNDWC